MRFKNIAPKMAGTKKSLYRRRKPVRRIDWNRALHESGSKMHYVSVDQDVSKFEVVLSEPSFSIHISLSNFISSHHHILKKQQNSSRDTPSSSSSTLTTTFTSMLQDNRTLQILGDAEKGSYGIVAMTCYDALAAVALVRAAERAKSPAIMQLFPITMRKY